MLLCSVWIYVRGGRGGGVEMGGYVSISNILFSNRTKLYCGYQDS